MTGVRLRLGLVVLGALVIQASLAPDVRVFGVHPDVLLAVAVAAAVVGGAERGTLVAFAVGLVADLVILQTPIGLAALTYCLVGFVVGSAQSAVLRSSRWMGPVTVGLASGAGQLLFAVIGVLVGQSDLVTGRLWRTALVVGGLNLIVGLAAVPVLAWAMGETARARSSGLRWRGWRAVAP